MNIEELREFCMSVKGATESFPFDDTTLVFKVMDKMFAYIGLEPKNEEFFVNLKCDPEKSDVLRAQLEGVRPGYHTNKMMWNSVYLHSDVSDSLFRELILHSVDEVILKLPKRKQEEYRNS